MEEYHDFDCYYDRNTYIELRVYPKTQDINYVWSIWVSICNMIKKDPYELCNNRKVKSHKWYIIKNNNSRYNEVRIPNFLDFDPMIDFKVIIYDSDCISGLERLTPYSIVYSAFDPSKINTRCVWRAVSIEDGFIHVRYKNLNAYPDVTLREQVCIPENYEPKDIIDVYHYPINPYVYYDKQRPLIDILIEYISSSSGIFGNKPTKISIPDYLNTVNIEHGWFMYMNEPCQIVNEFLNEYDKSFYVINVTANEIINAIKDIDLSDITYASGKDQKQAHILDEDQIKVISRLKHKLSRYRSLNRYQGQLFKMINDEGLQFIVFH